MQYRSNIPSSEATAKHTQTENTALYFHSDRWQMKRPGYLQSWWVFHHLKITKDALNLIYMQELMNEILHLGLHR